LAAVRPAHAKPEYFGEGLSICRNPAFSRHFFPVLLLRYSFSFLNSLAPNMAAAMVAAVVVVAAATSVAVAASTVVAPLAAVSEVATTAVGIQADPTAA